jgi:hypothetical protein
VSDLSPEQRAEALKIYDRAVQETAPGGLFARRARNRAAQAARDAAEYILGGRDDDARTLLSEAGNELDRATEREKAT